MVHQSHSKAVSLLNDYSSALGLLMDSLQDSELLPAPAHPECTKKLPHTAAPQRLPKQQKLGCAHHYCATAQILLLTTLLPACTTIAGVTQEFSLRL